MTRKSVSAMAMVLAALSVGACQTTAGVPGGGVPGGGVPGDGTAGGAGPAASTSASAVAEAADPGTGRQLVSGATVDTPSMERYETIAEQRGYTRVTGPALRDLVEGQTYSFDHPRGAEITMTYRPDGQTHARWEHPAGVSGEFDERWTIEDGEYLCAWGTKGDVCGTMYRKEDRLVRIRADGRMDLYEHQPQMVGQR